METYITPYNNVVRFREVIPEPKRSSIGMNWIWDTFDDVYIREDMVLSHMADNYRIMVF